MLLVALFQNESLCKISHLHCKIEFENEHAGGTHFLIHGFAP